MSESRGTYYLDLSDRMLLAQEGIEMIDISIAVSYTHLTLPTNREV